MLGFEPVRSSQSLADRFRSIHMVLYRKRNFSGPPLGGLAKNKSKLDHFKWFDVCPDATQLVCPSSQYPVLKVHAWRPIRSDRAARQGDILPDRRGVRGGNRALHILFTNDLGGPEDSQGLIIGHRTQTDRMTSVILLSDVDILALYPKWWGSTIREDRMQYRLDCILKKTMGLYQPAIEAHCYISSKRRGEVAIRLTGFQARKIHFTLQHN